MHKKTAADKKSRSRNASTRAAFGKAPAQINDLLRRGAVLRELATRIPEQDSWAQWLRAAVPPELAAHIVNVVPKPLAGGAGSTELVVFADSAAWCTRLRYTLSELEARINARDAAVQRTRVRVSIS
jgi:Dna[CI] antecedent, DciA